MKDQTQFKDHVVYVPTEVKVTKTKMVPTTKMVSKVVNKKRMVMQPVTTYSEETVYETQTVMKDHVKNVVKTKMVPTTTLEDHVKYEPTTVMTKAYRMVNKEVLLQKSVPVYKGTDHAGPCWCTLPDDCPCAPISYKNIQVPETVVVA